MKRERLDAWLVSQGLAPTRQKAQALVMAGRVEVNDQTETKPGSPVRPTARIRVLPGPAHVGRGALKLEGALDALRCDPSGLVVLDIGASTGGFVETLLSRGAKRVYAVDVGRAQLHESLSKDARVVVLDGRNARYLKPEDVPELASAATVDVSFISVLKVLPALRPLLGPGAFLLVLVKPPFELERRKVGRGGIIRDPRLHHEALLSVAQGATEELRYGLVGACASPIPGAEGNREFFLHLNRDGPSPSREAIEAMVLKAVEE